jgi:hypothetical protein
MVLKNVLTAFVCAALLAWSGVATADEYRPDQFLGLDLPSAVLSPKPLGPSSTFAPVPAEANADHKADRSAERAQARAEPKAAPRVVVHTTRIAHAHVAHARAEQPRPAARTRLAHRHSNPLDAQAFDTRIQVWPCRSGGICNWKR